MPGISPLCAISRKQSRQRPKRLKTAPGRPQRAQREYCRTLNFGLAFDLLTNAFFAIYSSTYPCPPPDSRNGNPSAFRRARPASSFVAVVTIEMSIPRDWSMSS